MGLWCGPTTTAGWLAAAAGWVLVVALAVWAVCRLFPAQRHADPRTPSTKGPS